MPPKLVCVECQAELRIKSNDVYVYNMFQEDTPIVLKVYEVWCADSWECPKCGKVTLSGFGANPIAAQYIEGFEKKLERIEEAARNGKCTIVRMIPVS